MHKRAREIEAADIEVLYEIFARKACAIVDEGREVAPQLAIVKMSDTKPGEIDDFVMIKPDLINAMQRDERSKDMLSMFIQAILHPAPGTPVPPELPDVVVHVTEAWVLSGNFKPGEVPHDPLEGYGEVRLHPNRTEAVLVSVHTPERTYIGKSPITGSGKDRRATYAPIASGGEWEGRFAGGEHRKAH